MLKQIVIFINAALISCALCAEHHINWWGLGPQYKDAPALGWLTLTFLIFVFLVVRTIKKPLSLYLEIRSKDIRKQIEEARLAKAESEKKLLLYEEKLKTLDQEIEKLRTAFAEQAAAEKIERERVAKEMAARILRDAEDTIKSDFEKTKIKLADEVVTRALGLAKDAIVKAKRDQVDEFLKASFIEDLKAIESRKTKLDKVDSLAKPSFKSDLKHSAKEVQ